MEQLPIFLNLQHKPCVVVGGGAVAARKAGLLLEAGACLTIVAPECHARMQELIATEKLALRDKRFSAEDLQNAYLVIAATDDEAVNEAVYAAAKQYGALVNVADNPPLCDFYLPAIVDRAPLTVAISSGGRAPVLARWLKARLERDLPMRLGRMAALMGQWRKHVAKALRDGVQRRRFWENVVSGPTAEAVYAGDDARAQKEIRKTLEAASADVEAGSVALVGAGPGDPELLTFKAHRLLQHADVVIYDRLVSQRILALARREAELVYVGKRRDFHTVPQSQISQMLVDFAKQGKRVVRLKGGDPFIFGRGGEEIQLLAEAGLSFQVVPGVTAAAGCAAYSGIPLTHRDYAQGVRFITGHTKDGQLNLDWANLAAAKQETLVFYMGLSNVEEICQRLREHGAEACLPAAVISQGTTVAQRVVVGDLTTLADRVKAKSLASPALLVIGDVVQLHEQLSWQIEQNDAWDAFIPVDTEQKVEAA